MAYIKDAKQKELLYNEHKRGNKKASEILEHLFEMPQYEFEEAMSKFEPLPQDIKKSLEWLIKDEYEAIDGYNKVIAILKQDNTEESNSKIQVLQQIINDELNHIQMLNGMLDRPIE